MVADQPAGKLVRIVAKVVRHASRRLSHAELAVPKELFEHILRLIDNRDLDRWFCNDGSRRSCVAARGFCEIRQNASVRTVPAIWEFQLRSLPALQPPKVEMPKRIEELLSVFSAPRSSAALLRFQFLHGCQRLS
jgi:hypothetical protein